MKSLKIKPLCLLLLVMVVFCSCNTSQHTTHTESTRTDTVYRTIYELSDHHTARTDTLHDSIYVREVLNEQGEIRYKERIVYRDRIGNTIVKTNTVHDTIKVNSHSERQNMEDKEKVYKTPLTTTFLKCVVLFLAALIVFYAVKRYK